MRPHDETWTYDGEYRVNAQSSDADASLSELERLEVRGGRDVGRLAAQAPAMVRLLLKYIYQEAECLECRQGVYWDDTTDTRVQPHLADCALQAVLRAAGVL